MIKTDIIIIGAGPVGLFTVFEAGLLKLKCHLIDSLPQAGGQCSEIYPKKPIYDIPAYPEIISQNLVDKLYQQAAPFSPQYFLSQQVVELESCSDFFKLKTSAQNEIQAKVVVIAAGAGSFGPNRPPLENIETYEGKSVFYLVTNKYSLITI